jgi:hypothetical protein
MLVLIAMQYPTRDARPASTISPFEKCRTSELPVRAHPPRVAARASCTVLLKRRSARDEIGQKQAVRPYRFSSFRVTLAN